MPIMTKMPTHRSIVARFMDVFLSAGRASAVGGKGRHRGSGVVIAGQAPTPRNMNTVSTKSAARIVSADSTTVRVVAEDTPSAVGCAS